MNRAMGAHGASLVPQDALHPDSLQRWRSGNRRIWNRPWGRACCPGGW